MVAYGANIPPDYAWMMGKTVASIQFVKDALSLDHMSEQLQFEVDAIMRGDKVLTRYVDLNLWRKENENV
jgi:hypothetical protein